jgi:ribose 5-phosphate isomerase B
MCCDEGTGVRIAVGADHGGFELKQVLTDRLKDQGLEVEDLGAYSYDPDDDYPDFALAVARAVAEGRADRGLLVCGSGVGACVAANKVTGVRAALAHDSYSARQGVEHDDVNVLCLGARVVGEELAADLVRNFVNARFSGAERHRRRLAKVGSIESQYAKVDYSKDRS